jgi:hypothetical protein
MSGGSVCGPMTLCTGCKMAGVEGCNVNADCCDGALCVEEKNAMGMRIRTVCKDRCMVNTDCNSNCCAPLGGTPDRVCSAPNFCGMPAPPANAAPASCASPAARLPGEQLMFSRVRSCELGAVTGRN